MKTFLSFFLILISIQAAYCQADNASLLVQSPDGKTVKLIWFLKSWNPEITGFDIRRKQGLQDWVKINSEPILPGVWAKKKLEVVESDKIEEGRIKDKLYDMLRSRQLKEMDNTASLQLLNTDDHALPELSRKIAMDYDIALLSGFAFVDHTVTMKTEYKYGLFIQGTDKLLAEISWNYGEIPDLNVVKEITSHSTTGKKGVQVFWTADVNKMKLADVAGFNIYREGLRMNDSPIVAQNGKDVSEFSWYSKSSNADERHQYSISAVSILGVEGIIKSYIFDPADHPKEYKKAEVTEVTAIGYYFKEGIDVQWTFPKEYEHFVKGFYLEKDNMPDGYTQVSPLLEPSVRRFVDHTSSPVSDYVRFRVVVEYNDRSMMQGRDRLYNYFPVREPPRPQNIRIKSATEDKKFTVHLSWDPPMVRDSFTEHYVLYMLDPVTHKVSTLADKIPLHTNSYRYAPQYSGTATYKFWISAVNKAKIESQYSDTVSVQTPGMDFPVISKTTIENDNVVIEWQYSDEPNLKGFKLFDHGNMIVGDDELKKNARQYTMKAAKGTGYEFTIRATFEGGSTSLPSLPVQVNVPAK